MKWFLFGAAGVLLLAACGQGYNQPVPAPGDPCSCANDLGLQWVDDQTNRVIVQCVPSDPSLTDGDPSTVCLGSRCCTWAAGMFGERGQ